MLSERTVKCNQPAVYIDRPDRVIGTFDQGQQLGITLPARSVHSSRPIQLLFPLASGRLFRGGEKGTAQYSLFAAVSRKPVSKKSHPGSIQARILRQILKNVLHFRLGITARNYSGKILAS
jgi:hypothetical protein